MQWHIKSVKFEEKVTVDENFRKKNNNNYKTKEQNLKETCAKSEWSLLLDIEYPYKKTGDRATRSKCRSF